MSIGSAICLVCGEPLDYFEKAQEVSCHICGKKEYGHSICIAGHYVCDACHRTKGVDWVIDHCKESTSQNPIEIAMELMDDASIYPNGPEHHTLIGASLMTAYKNAGGDIDLERSLAELRTRSMQVPGGTCGFWGTCGAATSAGQFYSIIAGSTPMTRDPWARTQRLTSNVLGRLADLGGPRCCKRTGFTAIQVSAEYVQETLGVSMEMPEHIVCKYFSRNKECLKRECPFFPNKSTSKA